MSYYKLQYYYFASMRRVSLRWNLDSERGYEYSSFMVWMNAGDNKKAQRVELQIEPMQTMIIAKYPSVFDRIKLATEK